jgi:serine/threonine protein kinase
MIAPPLSAPPELPELDEPAIPQGAEPESAIQGLIAGRYDLGDQIARGGMGIIYRAHDRQLNRTVAFKVMRSRFMDRADLLRRFLAEARISGRLQHPGVVPVYEVGTLPDARPFIAMKLIEGKTLSRQLKERKTPAENLAHFLKIFETLCQTMAYAHRLGVIHRDLKPDNIMVGEFGEVQVMDWGLAKFLDPADAIAPTPDGFEAVEKSVYLSGDGTTPASGDHPTLAVSVYAVGLDSAGITFTTAGEVFGTLPYMPPEQARGEIDRVDRRGDVFALGAILCQILTGQPPYFGSPETLRDQARGGKLFGAYVLLDRCGADQVLVLLAKHCLAVDPEARPADAGALAGMVTQCLDGLQDRNRQLEMSRMQAEARLAEAEARERLARKARRLARMLAVAGVMVAALLAAWIGYFTRHRGHVTVDNAPQTVVQQSEPEPQPQPEPQPPTPGPVAVADPPPPQPQPDPPPPQPQPAPPPAIVKVEQPKPDAGEILKQGLALADAGKVDEALEALKSAVQVDPKLVAAHVRIGELLLTKNKADDSRNSFNTAIEIDPNNGPAQLGLAKAEVARGDLDGAAIAYKAAVSLPEYAAAAHAGLGRIHLKRWEATKAANQFRQAIAREPKNLDHRLGLIEALRVANDNAGALREAKAAAAALPKSAAAHRVVGDLLDRSRDKKGAAEAYKAAVDCEPTDTDARLRLAALYEELHDSKSAAAEYQAVADLRPKDAKPLVSLGRLHEKSGDFAKAIEAYRRAVSVDPKDGNIHRQLGRCLVRTGDEAGIPELRAAADALLESGDVRVDLGNAYWELGRFRPAATAYREAADKYTTDTANADAAHGAARRATRLAALEDKLPELISGAVTFSSASAWADVGEMCRRTKRFAAAARFYGEAAERDIRYAGPAATCAALAGFGRGSDANDLSEEARLEWRKTALTAFKQSHALAKDPALADLRKPATLDDLSDKERQAWKAVWEAK